MKWSWKLGRFAGIDVYVHVTFLLLLGIVAYHQWVELHNLRAAVLGTLFLLCLFGCVLLHEFGHALSARRYGIKTRDITLLPIGGVARLERMPEKPAQELVVALAGPAVNVVIAGILFFYLVVTGSLAYLGAITPTGGNFVAVLLVANVILVLFNMLPAFPMDGGRVLRALLAMKMNHARATGIAATIGKGMAVLFALAGLAGLVFGGFSPFLLLIALFVWMGASQEAAMAVKRSSLAGVTVGQAMQTRVVSLSPQQNLGEARQLAGAVAQPDFPVCLHGHLVGWLSRNDLVSALADRGATALLSEVMRRDFWSVSAMEPLESLLNRWPVDVASMPVTQDGLLVGLFVLPGEGEYLRIRSGIAQPARNSLDMPPPIPSGLPPRIPPRITPA